MAQSNLIVYNASAGSGKTFTLALEYAALCLSRNDPRYFRHILAITFTNKAAHELKERIIGFMRILGENDEHSSPSSSDLTSHIQERTGLEAAEIHQRAAHMHQMMLYRYSDLHISTIDSFILSVLRSFSKEIGLPFDFDIELDHQKIMDLLIDQILSDIGRDTFITAQLIDWCRSNLLEGKSWNPRRQIQSSLSTLIKEESIPYRNALLDSGQEGLEKGLGSLLSKRSKLLSRIRDIQSSTREFLTPWNIELH
ncbi:MAG: UvrD-helicase domain-containing protein, partial [Flavobacteriales bacterium]|nr:UvrD-helicase domain-containing protein [Flavobacteriales bacterium]